MLPKRIELEDILQFLGEKVLKVMGYIDGVYIDNLADVENVNETTLDWINEDNANKQKYAECSNARVILVTPEVRPICGKILIAVTNPKLSLALIGNYFFVKKPVTGVHPTAIVNPMARLGSNVSIGAYSVIGNAEVGDNSIIDCNVRISDDVILGKRCVIKSGAILGGAGFGYVRDTVEFPVHFPQIGRIIVGDDVEVGSNTCIDRGSLSDTVIGNGTKINNLCHIAHNNKIGENVIIAGCVNISGSNNINDNVWIAPNASVRGWVTVGEGAIVGMSAVVINDIPARETWVGNPARKLVKE